MKKLLLLSLTILLFSCGGSDDEGNPCIYEPTLSTEAVTDITETSATLNGIISILSENCEVPNNAEQGFVYSTEIQPTLEDTQVNVNGTNISTTIQGLTPNTTYYVRSFLTNNLGDFYGNEVSFTTSEEPCNGVYLAANGVTIKAYPCADIGDTGVIDGITYTVVDEAMLREMVDNEEDVTQVATTKVTNMQGMFTGASSFNQPIGNWDVSNVTTMEDMFSLTSFNQPIGNWDVSNVTNMSRMFFGTNEFDNNISSWNVSNVNNMSHMFRECLTYGSNIDLSSWDVSSVTDMQYMFMGAFRFNQDISSWNVSNVSNMHGMFAGDYAFNQDIGSWDVSSVTDMGYMFQTNNSFNQDISSWNVSNVNNMNSMFDYSEVFNQDIGLWDVSSVSDMYSMFRGTTFNQDLISWNVNNVISCGVFSLDAPQWTLPKPNFTNCNPD